MQIAFLGDALDHWKGSLFERLNAAEILRDFAVEPMISDPDRWSDDDLAVFARLLHVSPEQVIRHTADLSRDRSAYFTEIHHCGDLFLDPDTGIANGKVAKSARYLLPSDVKAFLRETRAKRDRLLVVYQHADRTSMPARAKVLAGHLEQACEGLHWCVYLSATVGMFFLSLDAGRIDGVVRHFRDLLGPRWKGRILTPLRVGP